MTGLALVRAWNMRDRFNRRHDTGALTVAAVTVSGRALKHCADVTRLAWRAAVRAGEFEARSQMVERPRSRRSRLCMGQ